MKIKKIIFGLAIVFVLVTFLWGCQEHEKFLEANFLVESIETPNEYQLIKTSHVKYQKLSEIDDEILVKEFLTELKNPNYQFILDKTKTTESKRNPKREFFFDLKRFNVTAEVFGVQKRLPEKVRYLELLDISQLNVLFNLKEAFWYDTKNDRIVTDRFYVLEDIHLIALQKSGDSEIALQLVETSLFLNEIITDETLKASEAYVNEAKVISTKTYEELLEVFHQLKDALIINKAVDKNALLADLIIKKENARKEVVIGSKINNEFLTKKEHIVTKNALLAAITNLETSLSKVIIINQVSEQQNYYEFNQLMLKNHYENLMNLIIAAKKAIVYGDLTYETETNNANINLFKTYLTKIENEVKLLGEKLFAGSLVAKSYNYQVAIYYETEAGFNTEADETITLQGFVGQTVTYQALEKEGYTISPESELITVLDQENCILKVKYALKRLIIPIDLDGGKNDSFADNYLTVFYNKTLTDEQINQLNQVVKQGDKYHSSYLFKHYETIDQKIVDLTKPFTEQIILKATYETSSDTINYQVKTYLDVPMGSPDEALYAKLPDQVLTKTAIGGSLLIYEPIIPEGFELDLDKSSYIFSKIGEGDEVLIYLKRKALLIELDLGAGKIQDSRVLGSRANLKYGQTFDILLSSIEMPTRKDNKFEIFKDVINLDTNEVYELGNPVYSNLNLQVRYRVVEKRIKLIAEHSYHGPAKMNGDDRINILRTTYIADGEKVLDPAFFMPDTYSEIAQFNPEEGIGFIRDNLNRIIANDQVFHVATGTNETTIRLKFIYRVNKEQAEHILYEEHFRDALLGTVEREVVGTITGYFDNFYFLENEDCGKVLVFVQKDVPNAKKALLEVGAKVKLSGIFAKNYNEFTTDSNSLNVGHFDAFTLKLDANSEVNVIENSSNPTNLSTPIDTFNEESLLALVDIKNLTVLDVNDYQASYIGSFDQGILIDQYYRYKVCDLDGNLGYLQFAANDQLKGLKKFLEIKPGHVLDLTAAGYLKSRVNHEGVVSFYDSKYRIYPSLFVNDFDSQVTVRHNDLELNLSVEFSENGKTPFVSHETIDKTVQLLSGTSIKGLINHVFDETVYNGYRLDKVLLNGEAVVDLNRPLSLNDQVIFQMVPETKYIEFYLGTLIPETLGEQLKLIVTYGGKTYETYPVDSDENFYKFILSYNQKDPYIKITTNFNSDDANNYVIIPDLTAEADILKYVAYETIKNNSVEKPYGNEDKNRFELSWGDITAFRWEDDTKGLVMHAFTTEASGDCMFADGSLYSRILTENHGLYSQDGERNMNKDYNMVINMYNYFAGGQFYMLDGNLTDSEINQNNNLLIRSYQRALKKDVRDDNGNLVEYETNEMGKYYFSKDSITTKAQFNKFGLGVVFVDLTPFVEYEGKVYHMRNQIPYQLQQNWNTLGLAKDNSRILTTKYEYFNYLENHQVPMYQKANGQKAFQHYARLQKELTFRIVNQDVTFKETNSNTMVVKKFLYEKIEKTLFALDNQGDRDLIFINRDTQEMIDFNYQFVDLETTNIDILLANKTDVTLRLYSSEIDDVNLAFSITNDYEVLTPKPIDPTKPFLKEYVAQIYLTDQYENLYNRFVVHYENKGLTLPDFEYQIPFNSDSSYQIYNFFDRSNVVIPSRYNTGGLYLIMGEDQNENLSDYYFKAELVDGTIEDFKTIYHLYEGTIAINVDLKAEASNTKTKLYLYKGLNAVNSTMGRRLRSGKVDYALLKTDDIGKAVSLTDTLSSAEEKLTITYETAWLADNKTEKVVRRKASVNDPFYLDQTMFEKVDGKKILYAIKENGKYVRFNPNQAITDSKLKAITIKAFYEPIYLPGEYVKVHFDLGKYAVISGLEEILYEGYCYLEVGKPLVLPNVVTILPNYQHYATFKQFIANGNVFDLDIGADNGDANLLLVAEYNFDNNYAVVKYDEYIERADSNSFAKIADKTKEFVIQNSGNYQYDMSQIVVPEGYLLDPDQTVSELINVPSLNDNTRYIKIYYKAKVFTATLDLNGGNLENIPTGLITSGDNYQFSVKYDQDLRKTVLKDLLYVPAYKPTNNGVGVSKIEVTYRLLDGTTVTKEFSQLKERDVVCYDDLRIRLYY